MKSFFIMGSNIKKPGKSHDKRIHLEQPREAVYWSKKFEVSSLQLLQAIKATGSNRVENVANYLAEKVSTAYSYWYLAERSTYLHMPRVSAGILLCRSINTELQFLLVHPGGPFFKNKDNGHWTIPKGEPAVNEDLQSCALREFIEEMGIPVSGEMIALNPVQQKGGKKVHAWAMIGDFDPTMLASNNFELEWPLKSGKFQQFPEVDKASWFSLGHALEKINPAQQSFLREADSVLMLRL